MAYLLNYPQQESRYQVQFLGRFAQRYGRRNSNQPSRHEPHNECPEAITESSGIVTLTTASWIAMKTIFGRHRIQ